MWGVDGVREDGRELVEALFGGVRDLVESRMLAECDAVDKVCSGDILGGVACGIEPSKSSARSSVENVRFASSAKNGQICLLRVKGRRWLTLLKV